MFWLNYAFILINHVSNSLGLQVWLVYTCFARNEVINLSWWARTSLTSSFFNSSSWELGESDGDDGMIERERE